MSDIMNEGIDYEQKEWDTLIKSSDELSFIVSSEQFHQILTELGNKIDADGFIIDAQTKIKEKSKDESEIKLSELGGILTGSKIFIKRNIASFSEHLLEKRAHQ
jgi:hypothetical protein